MFKEVTMIKRDHLLDTGLHVSSSISSSQLHRNTYHPLLLEMHDGLFASTFSFRLASISVSGYPFRTCSCFFHPLCILLRW